MSFGNLNGYDATNGQTMGSFDALPAGDYVAAISASEVKESKANASNRYLSLKFQVMEGEFSGRTFFTNINLWHSGAQTVEIAQRELNSICHAVGKLRVNDSSELHGVPMRVKLTVEKSDQFGDQNRVKGYKPLNDAPGAAPSNVASASPGASGAKPWGARAAS